MIDTHTHIYLNDFEEDRNEMLKRATDEGVISFLLPAIDTETFDAIIELENQFPLLCYAMTGLHPCSVKQNFEEALQFVHKNLQQRKFIAIGEIGLDFYWDRTFEKEQYKAFEQQMQWALDYKLPISIHTRNAMGETIEMVKPFAKKGLRGVFHCFGGSYETAQEIMKMNFFMGIGGVVTYKKSGLNEVLDKVPLEYLVLETDAPYLTPVPFRGKRNEPGYLKYVVEKIAEIKNCSADEVKHTTTENAKRMFTI